jgi:hypothetical protein
VARQRRNKAPAEFSDRVRLLARMTVPCVTDPVLRKFHNEQAERMLLASFVAGVAGTPGRQVRFAISGTMEEVLKIATTLAQAEIQEQSHESFYSDAAVPEITPAGRIRAPAHGSTGRGSTRHHTASSRTRNRHQQSADTQVYTRDARTGDPSRCYECGGVGHFARDCAKRKRTTNSNSYSDRVGGRGKPKSTREPMLKRGTNRGSGRKMQKPSGNPVRGSREDSACYLSSFQNAVEYQVVNLGDLNNAPVIRATVGGRQRIVLIDTGSSVSLIQPGVCTSKLRRSSVTPFGVTGDELQLKGEQYVKFCVQGQTYSHSFCVIKLSTDADAIVGTDFLRDVNAKLDLEDRKLWILKSGRFRHDPVNRRQREGRGTVDHVAHTVFSKTDGRGNQNSCWIGCKQSTTSRSQGIPKRPRVNLVESDSWLVKTAETIKLAPRVKQVVAGKIEFPKRQNIPKLVCVEPAQLPFEGVLAARSVSRGYPKPGEPAKQQSAEMTSRGD